MCSRDSAVVEGCCGWQLQRQLLADLQLCSCRLRCSHCFLSADMWAGWCVKKVSCGSCITSRAHCTLGIVPPESAHICKSLIACLHNCRYVTTWIWA